MGNYCVRDLNTQTREISPVRGNHANKVTRAGPARTDILRGVRCLSRRLACARQVRGISRTRATAATVAVDGRGPCGAPSRWAPCWPILATFRYERGDAHAQVAAVRRAREILGYVGVKRADRLVRASLYVPRSAVPCRTATSIQKRHCGMPTPPTPAGSTTSLSNAHSQCQAQRDEKWPGASCGDVFATGRLRCRPGPPGKR
jgi:hypothetical protein